MDRDRVGEDDGDHSELEQKRWKETTVQAIDGYRESRCLVISRDLGYADGCTNVLLRNG